MVSTPLSYGSRCAFQAAHVSACILQRSCFDSHGLICRPLPEDLFSGLDNLQPAEPAAGPQAEAPVNPLEAPLDYAAPSSLPAQVRCSADAVGIRGMPAPLQLFCACTRSSLLPAVKCQSLQVLCQWHLHRLTVCLQAAAFAPTDPFVVSAITASSREAPASASGPVADAAATVAPAQRSKRKVRQHPGQEPQLWQPCVAC